MHQVPERPLIVILGATGTGKSELAVEIAKRHNGEIINGDALQLYAGLPILTNKITKEEQQGIPHHLLGCTGIEEPTWVVSTFVQRALETIDKIRAHGRLPILVGGTHYYTQSLLFNQSLVDEKEEADTTEVPEKQWPILAEPTDVLLAELRMVDPVMAARWHPNDRRKIQRSLMIFLQTGKRASELYAEQKEGPDVSLRFDTLLFWVHTEQDVLRTRLDKRVETMVENKLEDEVKYLRDYAIQETSAGRQVDKTRGIWVAIGYKEFEKALDAAEHDVDVVKAKREAIERTQIANRQYAKRQIRWIRIKLAQSLAAAGAKNDLYLLDSTDVSAFQINVVDPAAKIVEQFLTGEDRPLPSTLSAMAATVLAEEAPETNQMIVRHCEVCGVSCSTDRQWQDHARGQKHRQLSAKQRRNAEIADCKPP